jgi:DNA-3-methyladenine glycosylase
MQDRRGTTDIRLLCSGPGRLGQALAVDARLNGASVAGPEVRLEGYGDAMPYVVMTGPRIGITKAVDVPWRFGAAGSRFVSRPFST